jgi:general secretion pathway protein L
MVDQLILRITSAPMAPITLQWGVFRGRRVILGPREGTLPELVAALDSVYEQRPLLKVFAFTPVEWTTLTQTPMPSVQPKVLNKALPYALEEQLAEDVEDLHFVVLGKPETECVQVAVISKAALHYWVDELKAAGFNLQELVPDGLCVPYGTPDHWSLILLKERVLLRTDTYTAFAFKGTQIPVILDAVFDEIGAEQQALRLTLINEKSDVVAGRVLDALGAEIRATDVEIPIKVERRHIDSGLLEVLAHTLINWQTQRRVPNLLVGAFKQEVRRQRVNVKWKPVAALLALWFVLQLGVFTAQGLMLSNQAAALETEALNTYKRYFPGDPNVNVSILKRRIEGKLRGAGGGSAGFLPAFSVVGAQIYEIDRGRHQTIQLRRVTYEGKSGELRLEMSLSDFNVVNKLKQAIESQGAQFQQDASNRSSDGRINSRVRIKSL